MSEWQPIETAPRDGTDILAYSEKLGGCLVVSWEQDGILRSDFPWATLDGPNYHKAAFTHWMPLPEPPKDARTQAADELARMAQEDGLY